MIIVHHLNNSRSHRIIWLLEELGVQYQIKYYYRDPKTFQAPETLKEIHPLGQAPVLTDDDITIAESGAIIEYILNKYGQNRLKPATGTLDWIQYNYWMYCAEGTLMPMLFLRFVFENVYYHSPFFIKPIVKKIKSKVNMHFIEPRLEKQMAYIESMLEKSTWLAGNEFTAADIHMAIPLIWASADKLITHKPKIDDFLIKVKNRPAFIKTLAKGGEILRIRNN